MQNMKTLQSMKPVHSLKSLPDGELLARTRELVAEERQLTARVLVHLEEIDRRGLFLQHQCSSLFEFCQKELGYSENEAFMRISATRLSRELPEVVRAVESGRVSLTNLAKVQSYFRQEKKAGKPVSIQAKRELLVQVQGLSTRECRNKLMPEGKKTYSRVFEIDAEIEADLRRIRELWGNQDLNDTERLRKMAKLVLSRIDPETKAEAVRKKNHSSAAIESNKSAAPCAPKVQTSEAVDHPEIGIEIPPETSIELGPVPHELITPESRFIPAAIRRQVWLRDQGRCTHEDKTLEHETNGKQNQRCTSRYALQVHHLDPYAYGGVHTADNLALLCRAHHCRIDHGP